MMITLAEGITLVLLTSPCSDRLAVLRISSTDSQRLIVPETNVLVSLVFEIEVCFSLSLNRHQMVVEVSINHGGRYSFLLDTGTQMTMIDPVIASSLQLPEYGNAKVASAGMSSSASFSKLALVEIGLHKVTDLKVLVYDLSNLRATGLTIQGVLGEDFLEHFDVLIDNVHKLLCLESSGRSPHRAILSASLKKRSWHFERTRAFQVIFL